MAADPHEECEEEAGLFSKQTDRADRLRERDTTRNRWLRTKSVKSGKRPGSPHTRKKTERERERERDRHTTRHQWRRTKSGQKVPGTPHTRKKTERQSGQTKRQRHDQEPVAADEECNEAWQASNPERERERERHDQEPVPAVKKRRLVRSSGKLLPLLS